MFSVGGPVGALSASCLIALKAYPAAVFGAEEPKPQSHWTHVDPWSHRRHWHHERLHRGRCLHYSGQGLVPCDGPTGSGAGCGQGHKQIMAHVKANVPWGLEVEMKNVQNCNPIWIDSSDRGLQISAAVQTEIFRTPPVISYVGGGVGPASFLADAGAPKLVSFGFQQADENFHSDNEFMRISSFRKAVRAYPMLLHALVGQPSRSN